VEQFEKFCDAPLPPLRGRKEEGMRKGRKRKRRKRKRRG